jgi:type IV secretion system protein VirD4
MSKIVEGIAKDLKSIPEKLKAKTGNIDKKKLILMNLPYALMSIRYLRTMCYSQKRKG